jgi:hypothetical protein
MTPEQVEQEKKIFNKIEDKKKLSREEKEAANSNLKETLASIMDAHSKDKKSIADEEEKIKGSPVEIHNEIDEDNLLDLKRMKREKEETKTKENKNIFLEEEEEDEDWNMLPPFLRKKK